MLDSGGVRVRLVVGPAHDVRWRLLAGNGRVLGVSSEGFADTAGARAALTSLVGLTVPLVAAIKHPESSVAWSWRALDERGVVVAGGDRTYARYGTCQSSFERFRRMIGELDADDVDTLFRDVR